MRKWLDENRDHVRAYREATKEHRNARRRELYETDEIHREKLKASAREWSAADPGRRRDLRIRAKYKVDPQVVADMWEVHGCHICGANPEVEPNLRRHIDHDHRTGVFRGVLCQSCNLALGHMKDDPFIIAAALNYILQSACSVDGMGFVDEMIQ